MSLRKRQNEMLVKLQKEISALRKENSTLNGTNKEYERAINYYGWYSIFIEFSGICQDILKVQKDLIKIVKEKFPSVEKEEYCKGEDESLAYYTFDKFDNVDDAFNKVQTSSCLYFSSKVGYATLFLKEILKYSKENSCSFTCTIFDGVDYCDEMYYSNITNGELVYSQCASFKYSSWNIDKEWENTVDSIIEDVKEKDGLLHDAIPIVKSGVSGYNRGRSTVSYIMAYSFMPFLAASMLLKNSKASFTISNALMATDIVVNNGIITYPKIQNIETA